MNLLGAVIDLYKNGSSSALTTLRTDLGSANMYADRIPNTTRPFCILGHESTKMVVEPSLGSSRPSVRDMVISFAVFAPTRDKAELILDDLEAVYYDKSLTITGLTKLGIYYEDRSSVWDEEGWSGMLTLRYRVQAPAV